MQNREIPFFLRFPNHGIIHAICPPASFFGTQIRQKQAAHLFFPAAFLVFFAIRIRQSGVWEQPRSVLKMELKRDFDPLYPLSFFFRIEKRLFVP